MVEIMSEGLCYDDVLLIPQFSDIESRSEVSLETSLANHRLALPIVSANMDTVTWTDMAMAMWAAGGLGILHRYATVENTKEAIQTLMERRAIPVPSIGTKAADHKAADEYQRMGVETICVDIAHGDSLGAEETVKLLRLRNIKIIAGNVATVSGFSRLAQAGASVVKVGVGPGSLCTTRIVTGHGVPQLSAVMNIVEYRNKYFPKVGIIADGGIRNSGDIVKALAAGADAVMAGGLFAGTNEAPLIEGMRVYRGMASREAQVDFRGKVSNSAPEGAAMQVSARGPVKNILDELAGGIRSGLSYSGAHNLKELRENAQFIRVTPNCVVENGPHALKR